MIVLFDGVCNLCNSSVDFILRKAQTNQFKLIPLQSDEGKALLRKYEVQPDLNTVLFIVDDRIYSESDAVLEISSHLRAPWNWLTAFRILPKKFRDRLYRWVANNRYHWFGKRNSCRII